MASLKSLTDDLAETLNTTPAAIYERQRALVRARMLDQDKGRGPGSGVRATPRTIAILLIATLAAESLADVARRTREVAGAKTTSKTGLCPFTGKATFLDALEAVLQSADMAKDVNELAVSRTGSTAHIRYKNKTRSEFRSGKTVAELNINAVLPKPLVIRLSRLDKPPLSIHERLRLARKARKQSPH